MDGVSVRELRRRWKPHKERLSAGNSSHATPVRFHRACSWLARFEKMVENEDADLALASLWIAFNSLYGQWDKTRREPKPDRECWRAFVDRMLRLDQTKYLVNALNEHKRLAISLVEDPYLNIYFWQQPPAPFSQRPKIAKSYAQTWYVEGRWTKILDELLDRIYLMRCQLVHGAATYGSHLNRTSLRHCVWMLQYLISAFLMVWIDHGADEDWGPLCYPPQHASRRAVATNGARPRMAK